MPSTSSPSSINKREDDGQTPFYTLNSTVSLSTPGKGAVCEPDDGPAIILVLSWMSALPRHAQKYTSVYRSRYPNATIVHITTTLQDMILFTNGARRRELAPALDVIAASKTASSSPQTEPRVLLHLFSNGGAYTAAQLANAYVQKTGSPLPLSAMVLDSAPGRATYQSGFRAITLALPRSSIVWRIIGICFAHLLLVTLLLFEWCGSGGKIEDARRALNDRHLIDHRAARLYLYSKEDLLVSQSDIEDRAAEAEKCGLGVHSVLFEGSGHVSHAIADPKSYWAAVEKCWSRRTA
jgi:hypothetical protein